jgi:hypothetical protein
LGAFYEYRRLQTTNASSNRNAGGLYALNFGFPTRKNVGFGFGLAPYSTMGYFVRRDSTLQTDDGRFPLLTQRLGEGGVNEYYLGLAYRTLRKKLSFGVNGSFLFGTLNERWSSYVGNDSTVVSNVTRVSGFKLLAGITYTDTLKDDTLKNKRYFWRVGATVDAPVYTRGEQLRTLDYITPVVGGGQSFFLRDTLFFTPNRSLDIPITYGVGVHFDGRDDKDRNFFTVGMEAQVADWSRFRLVGRNDNLDLTYSIRMGAEYIPDPSSSRFFPKLAIRAGLAFQQTYFNVLGNNIYAFTGSLGFGLPVFREYSRFNFGVEMGTRGTTRNSLVQETTVRLVVGVTFNELWFLKRKYD